MGAAKELSAMARSVLLVAALLAALIGSGAAARAQQADSAAVGRVDPRSPRAALEDFLALAGRGQFDAAARYFDGSVRMSNGVAAERARKFKAVLDQHLPVDLDFVSSSASGDSGDGLPPNTEQITSIRSSNGVLQPIRMFRSELGVEPAWVFVPTTVGRIDGWYEELGAQWLRERMPEALQRPGLLGVERWQWVALFLLAGIAVVAGWFGGHVTISLARRAVRRTKTTFDDRILKHATGPIRALWGVLVFRILIEFIGLSMSAEYNVTLGLRIASAILITWLLVRMTYVLEEELPSLPVSGEHAQVRSFAPLIGRVARIFLFSIGLIAIVAQFGYSVTTLLTGLGIGGIALAFAAQKTLEHPFGSVAIGIDQPIRIGDWVKIGDAEGEVEAIGLRSTRIRTLARTLIVFPNGRLAEMQMENFGVRDRILLRTVLRLRFDTDADRLRRVRDRIENYLTEHPLVWPERIIVRFKGFGEWSLDVDLVVWIATTDFNIFRAAREEILLNIMDILEAEGVSLAYGAQALMLDRPDADAGAGAGSGAPRI
jgi:MscS family membrane protein